MTTCVPLVVAVIGGDRDVRDVRAVEQGLEIVLRVRLQLRGVSVAASFEIISAVESSAACIATLTELARL